MASSVLRSGQLQQRQKLPALMAWERSGLEGTLDHIVVQINEDKVVGRQLHFLVSALNADNVWTGCLEGLDQARGENRNKNSCPLQGKQEVNQCPCGEIQHGSVTGQEDDAGFGQSVLYLISKAQSISE